MLFVFEYVGVVCSRMGPQHSTSLSSNLCDYVPRAGVHVSAWSTTLMDHSWVNKRLYFAGAPHDSSLLEGHRFWP